MALAPMKKAMKAGTKKVAMKAAMKANKTMKAMKAKRISIVAKGRMAKSMVFKGKKEKTIGGIKKEGLVVNKRGKVVSKKASAKGKRSHFPRARVRQQLVASVVKVVVLVSVVAVYCIRVARA
ncbi:unnamed protein product [Polarella glacialis]|uniref:Uncharacterized protein n=1 Tax=Polarella glacialis TaxID=89957 RepID=A0A813FQ90_POLGL|nr:unnamed protein product [Polarella glacialis]CAE8730162.1 unnamed protein product [Polarella glacialis]